LYTASVILAIVNKRVPPYFVETKIKCFIVQKLKMSASAWTNHDFQSPYGVDCKWMRAVTGVITGTLTLGGINPPADGVVINGTYADTTQLSIYRSLTGMFLNANNTIVGCDAATSLTVTPFGDRWCTACGVNACHSITTAVQNSAFGYDALINVTSGGANTAVGYQAGLGVHTSADSVFIGSGTGANCDSAGNIIIGHGAGVWAALDVGSVENVFIGRHAAAVGTLSASSSSVGVGSRSLYNMSTGEQNVAIGAHAARDVTTATFNVSVGYQSGQTQGAVALTLPHCVAIGANTYSSLSGYSTCVGGIASAQGPYSVAIGYGAATLAVAALSVAVGNQATCNAVNGTAIGQGTLVDTAHDGAVALGYNTTTLAADECVVGQALHVRETAVGHVGFVTETNLAGAETLTAAIIKGGLVYGAPGGAVNLTTDSATNINAVCPGTAGSCLHCKVVNTDGVHAWTIALGADVLLVGRLTIPAASTCDLLFVKTAAGYNLYN
jgi:hypothetical protein